MRYVALTTSFCQVMHIFMVFVLINYNNPALGSVLRPSNGSWPPGLELTHCLNLKLISEIN